MDRFAGRGGNGRPAGEALRYLRGSARFENVEGVDHARYVSLCGLPELAVSGQLESRHFFRSKDTVQHIDGSFGTVEDSQTLYATVVWDDGRRQEVDQFDPSIEVIERAASE